MVAPVAVRWRWVGCVAVTGGVTIGARAAWVDGFGAAVVVRTTGVGVVVVWATRGGVVAVVCVGGFGETVVVVANAGGGAVAVCAMEVAVAGTMVPVVAVAGVDVDVAGLPAGWSLEGVWRRTTTGSGALRLCHQSQAG